MLRKKTETHHTSESHASEVHLLVFTQTWMLSNDKVMSLGVQETCRPIITSDACLCIYWTERVWWPFKTTCTLHSHRLAGGVPRTKLCVISHSNAWVIKYSQALGYAFIFSWYIADGISNNPQNGRLLMPSFLFGEQVNRGFSGPTNLKPVVTMLTVGPKPQIEMLIKFFCCSNGHSITLHTLTIW